MYRGTEPSCARNRLKSGDFNFETEVNISANTRLIFKKAEGKGIRTRFGGAEVARGCDCAPAAWLPQNMGTALCCKHD